MFAYICIYQSHTYTHTHTHARTHTRTQLREGRVRNAVTLQLSCSTWKTSWDKATAICTLTLLLLTTCSNGMSPISVMFLHSLWKASLKFRKDEYGKVVCTSFGHRYCPYPSNDKSNHDHARVQQLISTVCAALPSSGLTHFWDTVCRIIFSCPAKDSQWHTDLHCRCAVSSCL